MLTSALLGIFGSPALESAVPAAGVVPGPRPPLGGLLGGGLEPDGAVPPRGPAGLPENPADEPETAPVGYTVGRLGHERVAAAAARGLAREAGVEEDQAARRQVEDDEGEEADWLPPEVALELQQRPRHPGSRHCPADPRRRPPGI